MIPPDDEPRQPDRCYGVGEDEIEAYYRDLDAAPVELPTDAEILDMARAAGEPEVPF